MLRNDVHKDLTGLISDLVQIETENPPGNEGRCAKYIVNWFNDRKIEAELVHDPYENRPQVVARVGHDEPTLVLNGHMDVVPAGDYKLWTYDPYSAKITNGKLFGRGSTDMKTGLALAMLTAFVFKKPIESGEVGGSLTVQAVIGEEASEPGTKTLLEQGYDGKYGIVLEPTGMRTATSSKGGAWYEIKVLGKASHAGSPDQGKNAIQQSLPVLKALGEYDKRICRRKDELVGSAHATITRFNGGTKDCIVPESATITLDRRFLPCEKIGEIDGEIDALLAKVEREHNIETEWKRCRVHKSASINQDIPLARMLREVSRGMADVPATPYGTPFANDLFCFLDAHMEAVVWGPGKISQAHSVNECMDLHEATEGFEMLKYVTKNILS